MKKLICVLVIACLFSVAARAAEPETPAQAEARQKASEQLDQMNKQLQSPNNDMKDMNKAAGDLGKINDQLMTSTLTMLHMQKFMLDICGIKASDAPVLFAKIKTDEDKYLGSMSPEAKKALPGEYAKVDEKLQPEWDKSTQEQREKGCADIKAHATAAGAN